MTVRVYTPAPPTENQHEALPVGVYFHGGGWCCGDLDTEDNFCRMLTSTRSIVVVSVAYRLAPENPAPAQICDAVAAWTWVMAPSLDTSGIALLTLDRLSRMQLTLVGIATSISQLARVQEVHSRLPCPTNYLLWIADMRYRALSHCRHLLCIRPMCLKRTYLPTNHSKPTRTHP